MTNSLLDNTVGYYWLYTVAEPDRSCKIITSSSPLHVKHLSNSVSSVSKLSCGTKYQPWKVEAPSGQQIRVSLLNFESSDIHKQQLCKEYGFLADKSNGRNVTLCGVRNTKYVDVYTSASNEISIFLAKNEHEQKDEDTSSLFLVSLIG